MIWLRVGGLAEVWHFHVVLVLSWSGGIFAACFSAGEIDDLAEASHNVRRLNGQIAQDSNAAIPDIT